MSGTFRSPAYPCIPPVGVSPIPVRASETVREAWTDANAGVQPGRIHRRLDRRELRVRALLAVVVDHERPRLDRLRLAGAECKRAGHEREERTCF